MGVIFLPRILMLRQCYLLADNILLCQIEPCWCNKLIVVRQPPHKPTLNLLHGARLRDINKVFPLGLALIVVVVKLNVSSCSNAIWHSFVHRKPLFRVLLSNLKNNKHLSPIEPRTEIRKFFSHLSVAALLYFFFRAPYFV